jgi:hypothetical protein
MSGVLEVDGSSRYFFIIVTFTIDGEEVRALPEDGAGDNLTIVDVAAVALTLLLLPDSFVLGALLLPPLPLLPPWLLL